MQAVREHLEGVGLGDVAVSVITVAELYFGVYNSAKVAANLARADTFVSQIAVLPLTDSISKTFGRLKADLRKQGQPVADFDLLIASTALVEQRTLVTNNVRHYARVPRLPLENWTIAPGSQTK
ncbi:MAG: PIN domain-containing protein [Chloroflexi bacterium]|nr:PIN domain-containing protein [Chloroflexota bacterium]